MLLPTDQRLIKPRKLFPIPQPTSGIRALVWKYLLVRANCHWLQGYVVRLGTWAHVTTYATCQWYWLFQTSSPRTGTKAKMLLFHLSWKDPFFVLGVGFSSPFILILSRGTPRNQSGTTWVNLDKGNPKEKPNGNSGIWKTSFSLASIGLVQEQNIDQWWQDGTQPQQTRNVFWFLERNNLQRPKRRIMTGVCFLPLWEPMLRRHVLPVPSPEPNYIHKLLSLPMVRIQKKKQIWCRQLKLLMRQTQLWQEYPFPLPLIPSKNWIVKPL